MTHAAFFAALLAVWYLLWGDISLANTLSGIALGAVLFVLFPTGRPDTDRLPFRPFHAARFVGYFIAEMIISNIVLARTVVQPRGRLHTGILAVPVPACSPPMIAFVANMLGLTPGTMAVETSTDPPVIYVHVLQLGDIERARRDVERLVRLTVAAFGSDESLALLKASASDAEASS